MGGERADSTSGERDRLICRDGVVCAPARRRKGKRLRVAKAIELEADHQFKTTNRSRALCQAFFLSRSEAHGATQSGAKI